MAESRARTAKYPDSLRTRIRLLDQPESSGGGGRAASLSRNRSSIALKRREMSATGWEAATAAAAPFASAARSCAER